MLAIARSVVISLVALVVLGGHPFGTRLSSRLPADIPADIAAGKLFGIVGANGPNGTSGSDAKNLGITLDRIEFTPTMGVTAMDALVSLDASHGLTPLVLLSQYSTGTGLPLSGFDLGHWKSWAGMVVSRYGPGGSFWRGRTDNQYAPTYFEILNEPYGLWFYTPPEPAAYATFFANVAGAARFANPRARFLLAGYPNTFKIASGVNGAPDTWSTQSWDDLLKAAPDGPLALRRADGVTSHPYGGTGSPGWLDAVATHNDFPALPVWITEIGYRINEKVDGVLVTPQVQADLMQRTLVDFASWPWAQTYIWFRWSDNAGNDYGVVDANGNHRPSYGVYQSFIATHQPAAGS